MKECSELFYKWKKECQDENKKNIYCDYLYNTYRVCMEKKIKYHF